MGGEAIRRQSPRCGFMNGLSPALRASGASCYCTAFMTSLFLKIFLPVAQSWNCCKIGHASCVSAHLHLQVTYWEGHD